MTSYRPEIDGLRALAVLPVILFHAGVPGFSGGYVGVDVFFVISGFLITSIIIREIDSGAFSIARFYERRARRILPALIFVMLTTCVAGWVFLVPDQLQTLGQSMVAVSLFVSNIFFWQTTDYFKPEAELQPLLHTWSLAVEEQFYVFFPLVLLLCWRHARRHIKLILALALLLSLALAEVGWRFKPVANFYLLIPRCWELLVGALVAMVPAATWKRHLNAPAAAVLTLLGLALMAAAVLGFDEKLPAPSFYTTVPVFGAALVIVGTVQSNPVNRLLALRPVVFVGLISYSAYLWHQPLFAYHRILSVADEAQAVPWLLVAVVFVLATLSWRFIERPFRGEASTWLSRAVIAQLSAASIAAMAVAGLLMHFGQGWPGRGAAGYVSADWDRYLEPNFGLSEQCEFGESFSLRPACQHGPQPTVLLWGDSYAMHLADGVKATGLHFVQATKSVCGPSLGLAPLPERKSYFSTWAAGCVAFNESVIEYLQRSPSIQYVVLASAFEQYVHGKQHQPQRAGYLPTEHERIAAFDQTIRRIRAVGKIPVLVAPPPMFDVDLGACLRRAATGLPTLAPAVRAGCALSEGQITGTSRASLDYALQLARRHDVHLVDLKAAICSEGRCFASLDGTPLYRDRGHLSAEGSALLARKAGLFAQLKAPL